MDSIKKLKDMKIEIMTLNDDRKLEKAVADKIIKDMPEAMGWIKPKKTWKKLDCAFEPEELRALKKMIRQIEKERCSDALPGIYPRLLMEAVALLHKKVMDEKAAYYAEYYKDKK